MWNLLFFDVVNCSVILRKKRMSSQRYLIGETVDLGYQAKGGATGLTIIAEIYLPNREKDINFPDVTLVEVGTTGTYRGEFTPDQVGTWQVITHVQGGHGQTVGKFIVAAHNISSVGQAIIVLEDKVDSLEDAVDNLDTPPMAF